MGTKRPFRLTRTTPEEWERLGGKREFKIGFLGGVGASAAVWLIGWLIYVLTGSQYGWQLVTILGMLKFCGGTILLYRPGMEGVGWGVLTSFVVGLMPNRGGGVVRNDWIRQFLGGVAMYSAGVGFVTNGNYVAAAKLLRDAYSDGVNRRERFIIEFTYGREDVAAALNDGREQKQYVPFSELMHVRLGDEVRELSSGPAAFETSFDEWELLLAFMFGELQQVKADEDPSSWITPGRYVWRLRYEIRSPLFPNLRDPDSIEQCQAQRPFNELVAAGFFGGKWERVLELRKILLQVASNHRWR